MGLVKRDPIEGLSLGHSRGVTKVFKLDGGYLPANSTFELKDLFMGGKYSFLYVLLIA